MRLLVADVGYGTTDILIFDTAHSIENCAKLVVPSRTQVLAAKIRDATRKGLPVVMDGVTMGGGPVSKALKEHLKAGQRFMATPSAALTFNDDLDQVRSWGVIIEERPDATAPKNSLRLVSGDINLEALLGSLNDLGVETELDGAAIGVQDHGFAPGSSNRKFRFAKWRELLDNINDIDSLAFKADAIPEYYTRMNAAASLVAPVGDVIVMDTGPAALRGALSSQLETLPDAPRIIANCGNGHTLAAIVTGGAISGLVEHHTGLLDASDFETMLRQFTAGTLNDSTVFGQGGHGCLPPKEPINIDEYGPILMIGPKREVFRQADLPMEFVAPYGDMMLTGCFGLAGAWLRIVGDPSP
jgi:uncharacterized protein (DUF1786 family)